MQVYKARFHGSPVAVKAMIGEEGADAAALQHEAAILEGLRHSHIVHYLDCIVDVEDGTVCAAVPVNAQQPSQSQLWASPCHVCLRFS